MNLWQAPIETFIETLQSAGVRRAYLVTDPATSRMRASHPALGALAETIGDDPRDFHQHEGCFFEIGKESGHLLGAFVHKTRRGQAAGGTRYWTYPTLEKFMRDGLRLSRGMGHKCALAGLWWGGGKGVIARRQGVDHMDPQVRRAVFQDYGRFISGLQGCYVTAEDVGATTEDMAWIFSTTRHTTCIPQKLGGSGNPSPLTATGVVVAMEAALEHLGLGTLEGKTVAMQGLGNVATFMIKDLLQRKVARIVGADIEQRRVDHLREQLPDAPLDLRVVALDDASILGEQCDILAPNAVGAILNPETIPQLRCRVICGGANNQLEQSDRDGAALLQREILYVPDFLANRMGIVNCANEQYGTLDQDPAIQAHLQRDTETGVFQRTLEVFKRAKASGLTPAEEAVALAEEMSDVDHPIWGHRGQSIINNLVKSGWDQACLD